MNRYSFSGKGNILIKAGTSGSYGGKVFDAGEPIAYFTDVMIDLAFNNLDKVSNQGIANLAVDSKSEPSLLRVQNIKVSESLQSLLYKKETNQTKNKTSISQIVSEDGLAFLPMTTGEVLSGEIFIYKLDKERITDFTFSPDGQISGLQNGTYLFFYSVNKTAVSTYFLQTPIMPYVSAQVTVIGNLNEKTGETVIHLDKLKLLSSPALDFNNENPFVESLEFAVINEKSVVEVNYYANI